MDDYSTEPRLNFKPLGNERYCEFYSLEMDEEVEDISFYAHHCKGAKSILELGCGTGRISHSLAAHHPDVTGLDISPAMLNIAEKRSTAVTFVEGDMTAFSLNKQFSHILVPYNTLNLLHSDRKISACLKCITTHLQTGGKVLLQLFIPSAVLRNQDGERSFQFKLIRLPDGGKLIKETIRSNHEGNHETRLEERYRVRPKIGPSHWEDLSHTIILNTPDLAWWLERFDRVGLSQHQLFCAPQGADYKPESDNGVFILASK